MSLRAPSQIIVRSLTVKRAGDVQKIGEASAAPLRADFPSGFADEVHVAGFVIGGKILEHPHAFFRGEETRLGDVIGEIGERDGGDADQMQDGTQHLSLLLGSRLQTPSQALGRCPSYYGLRGREKKWWRMARYLIRTRTMEMK